MHLTGITTETDEELARRARAGSLDCFEELVRRYQVPLMHFLQRRSTSRHDAEDVLQETFMRAWRSIAKFREGSAFRPWLFTIAARVSIDAARRRQARSARTTPAFQSEVTADGPVSHAARSDSNNRLWQIVKRVLSEESFRAIWLHYGESMSSADIASAIGRSRVWVKTTLFRARGKLKTALEHDHSFDDAERLTKPRQV